MASETYFVLKAESRMQVRMTWLLWNLHLQEAEGINVYNQKQNKTNEEKILFKYQGKNAEVEFDFTP